MLCSTTSTARRVTAALNIASETPGWKIVAEYSHIGHGFSTDKTMGTYGVVQKDK